MPATTIGMWDEEDGFFYDVLRLPDGSAAAPEGPLDGRPAAALRGHGLRRRAHRRSTRSSSDRAAAVPRSAPGAASVHSRSAQAGRSRIAGWRRSSTRASCGACSRRCSTRTSSSARTASARCRAITPSIPYVFHVGGQEYRRRLPAGRVRQRHVRRQLQLARADLDAGQRADHPRAAAVLRATTATTSRSNARPARASMMTLYQVAEELGRRLGSIFLRDERRPAAGLRRHARSSRTIRTGAICSCSTSTSTATTAPGSAPATRPAGPASSRACMHLFATTTPEQVLELGKLSAVVEIERAVNPEWA